MEIINIIIIIFVLLNVITNIIWDGVIVFDYFDWLDKICGNWDNIKKHFKTNHCEKWISSINFCFMTIFGILLIIGIINYSSLGTQNIVSPLEKISADTSQIPIQNGGNVTHWLFPLALCYVLARLLIISSTLLTSNLTEKWLSVIPSVSLQIFVLSLIVTTIGYKCIDENDNKNGIIVFIVSILLILILPFIILRLKPSKQNNTDINFKLDLF